LHRQQKRCLAAMPDRSSNRTFENLTLLARRSVGKRVARVEPPGASRHVELSRITLRAWLGEDLNAPATWPRILGAVGILIDLDLLDRRCGDVQAGHLHPV